MFIEKEFVNDIVAKKKEKVQKMGVADYLYAMTMQYDCSEVR